MRKKIMVVDDESDLRQLVGWFFKGKDYEVIEAEDGAQALKLVKEKKPDLILLDIMMPGMDGWEVSRRIKEDESLRDVPISMLSVLSAPEEVNKSLEYSHADVHISKPIDFYTLNKAVKRLIESYSNRPKKPGRLGRRPGTGPSELFEREEKNN